MSGTTVPKKRNVGLENLEPAMARSAIEMLDIYPDIEVDQVLKDIFDRITKRVETQKPLEVLDRYDQVFEMEMEGWCYGITNYPGEVSSKLIHYIIREIADVFRAALEHNVIFDIIDLSTRISRAAKYLVDEREIAFSILANFPNPITLSEDAQFALGQVVDQVEKSYGGALVRLERKWANERKNMKL
jgi:hypothetical protein